MNIKLYIHDVFGNVINEDHIECEENDILICTIHRDGEDVSLEVIEALKNGIKNALAGETKYLIIPDFISFKVLKIRK